MSSHFEGFSDRLIDVDGVSIHTLTAGSGPPLLLLHGYPESSLMWRHVAPALAAEFTVVVTDLRGYGTSSAPGDDSDHLTYSKRSMAADQVSVMQSLGFNTFSVAGHDRGGRVAHRMVLDYPSRIERLAVIDIVPTLHMFEHVDRSMADTYFHWFFLSQSADLPERLINSNPEDWIASRFRGRHVEGSTLEPDIIAAYAQSFLDPARVAASCADYRAAATIDLVHDRSDRAAGTRIDVPLLAMWGNASYVGRNFDVVRVWQDFANSVLGCVVPSDHYVPEEAPELTVQALRDFFRLGADA